MRLGERGLSGSSLGFMAAPGVDNNRICISHERPAGIGPADRQSARGALSGPAFE